MDIPSPQNGVKNNVLSPWKEKISRSSFLGDKLWNSINQIKKEDDPHCRKTLSMDALRPHIKKYK